MTWQRFEIAVEMAPGETRNRTQARLDRALWGDQQANPEHGVVHVHFPVPLNRQWVSDDEANNA